jgi:hypothetical protein
MLQVQGESIWPNPDLVLLLRAGLDTPPAAREAWREWRVGHEPELAGPREKQLLPLVYRNLTSAGIPDPELHELKRHYLATWVGNQRLFRLLASTLDQFRAAGIPTLVLKGAALVPLYYEDPGVRGMGDFDVMVPEREFSSACTLLRREGWAPAEFDPRYFDTRFGHAIPFIDGTGASVDLHCHALIQSCENGADDQFWEAAQEITIEGRPSLTLCATDHLVHVCAHGLTWVQNPPVRWAVDAVSILRKAHDELDWSRLVEVALARGVPLHVAASLDFLASELDAAIPRDWIDELRIAASTRRDTRRFEHWLDDRRSRPLQLLEKHWNAFGRGVGPVGPLRRVAEIPNYLRFWAQTDSIWKIPGLLSVRGLRVAGRRLGLHTD